MELSLPLPTDDTKVLEPPNLGDMGLKERFVKVAGKRFVYACADFALKHANWDENYHWGHNDAKGRVAEFLAQGQDGMKSSALTTGPYMNMLWDGMFVLTQQPDGTFVWANLAKSGKIPLIALENIGHYSLWLFNNPQESARLELTLATDEVSFADIAAVFIEVTGKKAFTFRWRYWGEGRAERRDFALLDRIHPSPIKSLGGWMNMVIYDRQPKSVLKGVEDLK